MKGQFNSWAAWILVNFDPEVLQWPGGSLIALFLSVYTTARLFWSIGTNGLANVLEAAR